jgi:hypothetical protein
MRSTRSSDDPSSLSRRFRRGEIIAHRDLADGRIWYARAEVVAEDSAERVLSYWAPGAEVWAPGRPEDAAAVRIPTEPWNLWPRPWRSYHVLCHWRPGNAYSVWLFWRAEDWEFSGWYVNLQSPFARTPIGFDATDDLLDIESDPDASSWWWKDADEVAEAVAAGLLSTRDARRIRREGMRAVDELKRGAEPFGVSWTEWRPDGRWSPPRLPIGWEVMGASGAPDR